MTTHTFLRTADPVRDRGQIVGVRRRPTASGHNERLLKICEQGGPSAWRIQRPRVGGGWSEHGIDEATGRAWLRQQDRSEGCGCSG